MNAQTLKRRIYEENLVEELLEKIGMHHIRSHNHNEYITCGMPDGDNPNSTTVYNDEILGVVAYTRTHKITDIIALVQYTQDLDFTKALKWICNELSLENDTELISNKICSKTPANKYIDKIKSISNIDNKQVNNDILIYDEKYLEKYYNSCYAEFSPYFEKDNISKRTQRQFGVIPYLSIDDVNWCTTYYNECDVIPIYDEIGNIIGIKARRYNNVEQYGKYIYFLPCNKSQNLYGLYITKDFINRKKEVIICEAEKGVMQLWEYGYKNAVAVGGHNISQEQVEKIIKLNVEKVVIAFDEDVDEKTLFKEYEKLKDLVKEVTCIIDKQHILNSKESPMDDPEKWENLYKECQFVPREWGDLEW